MAKERDEMVVPVVTGNSGSTLIGFGGANNPRIRKVGSAGTEPCQERLGGRCACGS